MKRTKLKPLGILLICFMLCVVSIAAAAPVSAAEAGGIRNNEVYRFRNIGSGKYLNVHLGKDANGTNVYQWTYDGSVEQRFRLVYNASADAYLFRTMSSSNGTNRVLDIVKNNGSVQAGCNVEIWANTDPPAQQFVFSSNGWWTGQKFRILAKSNTNCALAANGNSNGTSGGTGSTSAGNVYMAAVTESDYQYWQAEPVNTLTPVANETYFVRARHSSKYLDHAWPSTNVHQHSFNAGINQQWTVRHEGSGFYSLTPRSRTDFRLDVEQGGDSNSTNIGISASNGYVAQRFQFIPAGTFSGQPFYRINPRSSITRVLDVAGAGTADWTNIQLWDYTNVPQQQWSFERVETPDCSRAVTSFATQGSNYEINKSESENRYNKMPVWEWVIAQNRISAAYVAAKASANAAKLTVPNAANMLLYFLNSNYKGDNTPYTIPSSYILNAGKTAFIRSEAIDKINNSYGALRVPGYTVSFGLKDHIKYKNSTGTDDWTLGVNKCEFWALCTAGSSGSKSTVLHVRDYYDWETDYNGNILDIPVNTLAEFHYAGLAREYPVYGRATV